MSSESWSSSDEEYGLLKQALEVNLSSDFDPNSIPQDGHEYLQHVIYERSKCKKLAVATDLDCSKFRKNQTFRITQERPVRKVSASVLPSKEWQDAKLQEFEGFRCFIDPKLPLEPKTGSLIEDQFISCTSVLPTFTNFSKYSQRVKIKMLQLITNYLNSLENVTNIDDTMGVWIFAILTTLQKPLSPSCCHVIREFAKKCIDIRASLPVDADIDFSTLNFCICVVSNFFGQLDLADNV